MLQGGIHGRIHDIASENHQILVSFAGFLDQRIEIIFRIKALIPVIFPPLRGFGANLFIVALIGKRNMRIGKEEKAIFTL